MRTLTDSERRTIRLASIGIALYLALFFGLKGFKGMANRKAEYQRMLTEANQLKRRLDTYETRVLQITKWMEQSKMDPATLSKATVVAQASSAIQKSATSGGIQIGPVRETPARGVDRELASVQLEGFGPVPAVMSFLHSLGELGFPLVVESVQLGADPTKPSMIKVSLTIVILDFEQWKAGGQPHA